MARKLGRGKPKKSAGVVLFVAVFRQVDLSGMGSKI